LQQQKNEARQHELDTQQRDLQTQQQALVQQQALIQQQALVQQQALAEQQAALASQQAVQLEAVAVSAPAAAAPIKSAADSSEPGGVASVLGRLVKAGVWRNDESNADEPEAGTPATRMLAPAPKAESPVLPLRRGEQAQSQADADEAAPHPSTDAIAPLSPTPGKGGSDEESIEHYMERLMQRVRGDEGAPAAPGN